ncbi:hypothetical protein BGX30_003865, partial [Mortierella sp. GBA39]
FETETLKRMSTVIAEELGCEEGRIVVMSGPSHAEEVVKRCPTTVVVASLTESEAVAAQDLFMNSDFRVYTNRDMVGVELAGALKNIIALGAGMSDGLGFGDNAKAALLTRGLAEITRIGVEMGANPLTFSGLAGVGDLVATATSRHSRNWRAGSMLGQGKNLDEVLDSMGMVVEGVRTTQAAHDISKKYGVQMPIADQLYHVLFLNRNPRIAVEALMGRDPKTEMETMKLETWEQWHRLRNAGGGEKTLSKNISRDALKAINKKTGKNISESAVKKLASTVKPSTMQNEAQLRQLIKQVSAMANVPVSEETIKDIISAVKKSGMNPENMEALMKMMMKK